VKEHYTLADPTTKKFVTTKLAERSLLRDDGTSLPITLAEAFQMAQQYATGAGYTFREDELPHAATDALAAAIAAGDDDAVAKIRNERAVALTAERNCRLHFDGLARWRALPSQRELDAAAHAAKCEAAREAAVERRALELAAADDQSAAEKRLARFRAQAARESAQKEISQ
jgi:hypothetical protein